MQKYKKTYKRLVVAFCLFIVALLMPSATPALMEGSGVLWWGLLFFGSYLAYLSFLGTLVLAVNKNIYLWVGGSMVTGPLGIIISYVLVRKIAIQQGWN